MTHLDTTFLVDLLREVARNDQGAAMRKLDELSEEELVVSVHVACELMAGAELSQSPAKEREKVGCILRPLAIAYPDERFPERYAVLLAELQRRGEVISTMDLLIATAVVLDGSSIVTRNVREFERVPGLRVETY